MRKFMRTRGAAPQPPPLGHTRDALKTNGHANGVGVGVSALDQHSTLSRYWNGSEGSGALPASSGGVERALWVDEEFPPDVASLGVHRRPHDVVWLRPHELCARPRFLGDEELEAAPDAGPPPQEIDDQRAARWSAEPGEVGLSALACAAAALASTPRLLARAVPPHSFRRDYVGAFRFRFWVFGVWREVVVDDRLPARRAPRAPRHPPLLLASRSAVLPDDFTLPLLEKAYAKLYGSYAAARTGCGAGGAAGALQELSGGVVQSFAPPRQPRALLYQVLNSAVPRSTLLVATVTPEKDNGIRRLRNGLVAGQAYLVTGLARVREGAAGTVAETEGGGALVRMWAAAAGARGEWAGQWARDAPEWRSLPAADRELLARRVQGPGHFWMSFPEFARSFSRLELVHVGPDDWLSEPALHAKRPWRAVLARRRWRSGYNAGGPPGCPTAHTNPQFHLSVPRAASGRCHVVVSVTQQYAVGNGRGGSGRRLRSVGFAVYELPAGTAPRRAALSPDLNQLHALDVTHASRAREVATFFTLPPGQYLLVPHSRAHHDAAFLLRVLTDEHTDVWEVNDDNVIIRDVAAEVGADPSALPPELQATVTKLLRKVNADEVDAWSLRRALRGAVGARAGGRASLEVCRALVALRDPGVAGRVAARELPALLALLAAWRAAWRAHRPARCPRFATSAYELRALLWACGLTASNKVLECMVVRFARGATLSAEAFLLALARLHLAHERYRSLDTKMKSNPLSLEEMILMTVYS